MDLLEFSMDRTFNHISSKTSCIQFNFQTPTDIRNSYYWQRFQRKLPHINIRKTLDILIIRRVVRMGSWVVSELVHGNVIVSVFAHPPQSMQSNKTWTVA